MNNGGDSLIHKEKRDERDNRWDEMVRVLTVQERNKR